jgi:K+-transporting ATPase KdpF subunit
MHYSSRPSPRFSSSASRTRTPAGGSKAMELIAVGIVAIALLIYLIVALIRPELF